MDRSLLELPEDVLQLVMVHLPGNDAVRLASMHSTLRRVFRTLTSLQPSLVMDIRLIRGGASTPAETAAKQARQRRIDSFRASRAAHPGISIDAMTLHLAAPALLPAKAQHDAVSASYWLPLRRLTRLCLKTSATAAAKVMASVHIRRGTLYGHFLSMWRVPYAYRCSAVFAE